MDILESHGIPTTYDDEAVIATSGQVLRAYSDDELRAMLGKGMLLDATAAHVLAERGFGDRLGLRRIEPPIHLDRLGAFSAEEFFNTDFDGTEKKFLTLTIPNLPGRPDLSAVDLDDRAQVISRIVDPDARRHHVAMWAFENDLGGRVVVQAMDLASAYGTAYNHPHRGEQLRAAVRWLARDMPPILVPGPGVYPLALRKDLDDGRSLLGLFNLTLDPWERVDFHLADARRVARLQRLGASGTWRPSKALTAEPTERGVRVRYDAPVPYDQPVFVTVDWA